MRGISPIVATLLLIATVLALGIIIYMGVAKLSEQTTAEDTSPIGVSLEAYKEVGPPGIASYYLHYYLPVSTPMNWVDAFNYCKERGMFLATPRTDGQNSVLKSIVSSKGWSAAYIGVYQSPESSEPDGGWKYITGDPIVGDFWMGGKPDDANGEDVAVITSTGWDDRNGSVPLPFICEKIGIGFTVSNHSSTRNLILGSLTLRIETLSGYTVASKRIGEPIRVDVNIGGTVRSLYIPVVKCDTILPVSPGGSASCTLQAIPSKTGFQFIDVRVCLVGKGLRVCDTTAT